MDTVDLIQISCEECFAGLGCNCLQSEPKQEELKRFHKALNSYGFVQIVNHGVNSTIVEEAEKEQRRYFSQSYDYKMSTCSKDKARRGYSPNLSENFASLIGVSGSENDSVEKYRIGPLITDDTKNLEPEYYYTKEGKVHYFPNNIADLETNFVTVTSYYTEMEKLSKLLIKLITYCAGLPYGSLEQYFNKHTSILSLNYYPYIASSNNESKQQRVATHTDVSIFTIVSQFALLQDKIGSLEVLVQNEEGEEVYIPVPYTPNALVVNVGDCLQHWSGGLYKSSMHRVVTVDIQQDTVTTAADSGSTVCIEGVEDMSRYSMAYFYSPNYNALLQWPTTTTAASSSIIDTAVDYSTWRKEHIKRAMKQLKLTSKS